MLGGLLMWVPTVVVVVGVRTAGAGSVDENDWLLQQHEREKNVL